MTGYTRRRMAYGTNLKRGLPLMEWELSSRVVNDLVVENSFVLQKKGLKNRIERAQPRPLVVTNPSKADAYVGAYFTCANEDPELCYFGLGTHDGDVYAEQVWPDEPDENGKQPRWYIGVGLIEDSWTMGQAAVTPVQATGLEGTRWD